MNIAYLSIVEDPSLSLRMTKLENFGVADASKLSGKAY